MTIDSEDLREIHQKLNEISCKLENKIGRYDSHVENQAIHQLPPCEHHKVLSAKLWAVALASGSSLLGFIYTLLKSGAVKS